MSPELIESEPVVTPELATCEGKKRLGMTTSTYPAVLDYPEDHHTKREDGDHPYLDGFSNEGSLGFDPPLELMGNVGYLSDSEGRMEMSVDYVGPEPLNCQRHVPQEHPPDVKVDTLDESEDLRGDTLVRSPLSDSSEITDVQGNQAHIVSRKPAERVKGKVLRIQNRKGGSRYVRSTGESCMLTPEWYKMICDWARKEFRPELNPLPKFQGDNASKPNPLLTSSRRQHRERMQMLTCDRNGRPMGSFVPWSDHTLFLHPKESEIAGIFKNS